MTRRRRRLFDTILEPSMRIFITGATGFLGNNLVRMLLEQGHQITAAKRMTSDPRPLDSLDVEAVDVDLNDSSNVSLYLRESDLVIHSAAMIQLGWSKLEASRKVNVEATRTLAQAARRQGIRMIHVSTVDTLASCTDQPINDCLLYTSPSPRDRG